MTEITDDEIPDPDMWLGNLMMMIRKTPEPGHMFEIPEEEKNEVPSDGILEPTHMVGYLVRMNYVCPDMWLRYLRKTNTSTQTGRW